MDQTQPTPTPKDVRPLALAAPADGLQESPDSTRHVLAADHVEDVLDVVGPRRRSEAAPGITILITALPPQRQREVFRDLLAWPSAQAIPPTDTGGSARFSIRFDDRPQIKVAALASAVGQRLEPGSWTLREDVTP